MIGNSVWAHALRLSVCLAIGVAVLSPSTASGASKPVERCRSIAVCARNVVATACRNGDTASMTSRLSKRFNVPERRLAKGLRRLNSASQSRKLWCELSSDELVEIVRYAGRSNEGLAESREEWYQFTMADENGVIPADGLSRALEQRSALVRKRSSAIRANAIATPSLAALPSSPAGWTNVTGYTHPVGRINDLLIHPTATDTMWAGTDGGGIWKTTDGGATWEAANDFLASLSVASFAMRPGDPSIIYAATGAHGAHTGAIGAGVFKSTDGGTTWAQLPATAPASNADWRSTVDLAIHPTNSNIVLAATTGGAYLTTDGGAVWTEIPAASTRARDVAIHPANGNLRVIAMNDGTVKIATDGVTYNSFTIATTTESSYTRIALAPSNQSIMYALVNVDGVTTLYRSSTGGTSWSTVTTPATFFFNALFYTGGLWIDPNNPNHIAVVEGWAMVTSDASVPAPTWSESGYGWVDFHGAVNHPGYNGSTNKQVFFFDDGGLYRFTDVDTIASSAPAYLAPNGINVTEAYTVAGRGGNLIFGAQDVATRYYRPNLPGDATPKWRFASGLGGHDGAATAADRTNSSILFGSTQRLGIHRSNDGGVSTAFICHGITEINCGSYSGNAAFIAPFVLDPNNQSRMLAGAMSLWRSNNVSTGTPTWSTIHTGIGTVGNLVHIWAIAVAASNSDVIWVAYSNGTVYKTQNGTATTPTWTQVTTVPAGNKLRIYIDRTNANRVYLGLSGFSANRLVTTPDGGATWSPVAGLPNASVFAIQQHPSVANWLYAGTAVGLFASEDGGATWSTTNEGPANVQVRDLNWYSENASSAELLLATFGRGIWRATISAIAAPTGVTAAATGTTAVLVSWNTVAGASSYKVFRSSSGFSFTEITSTASSTYTDNTASSGAAYLYMVRASDGASDSGNSVADLATTVIFTDPTLTAQSTIVKHAHISQLRTAVNAVRTLAGIGTTTFTDETLSSSIPARSEHLTELRAALSAARGPLGLAALVFTDPTITPGTTLVKAAHVTELRAGVQ